jgi:hypothetical protein
MCGASVLNFGDLVILSLTFFQLGIDEVKASPAPSDIHENVN